MNLQQRIQSLEADIDFLMQEKDKEVAELRKRLDALEKKSLKERVKEWLG